MPNKICRTVPYQTTLGVTVAIQKAPIVVVGGLNLSQHTLPDYQVSVATAAAINDETISITLTSPPAGVTNVYLDAGTVLAFPGATSTSPPINVVLAAEVIIGATAVSVATLPIPAVIAAAAIAKTKALLFLPGCRNAIVTPTIKVEDTTNYTSGTGMEGVVTGNSKKSSMEVDLVYGSLSHDILLSMLYADSDIGRHAYLDILFPSGERHQGYALMTTATPAGQVQAKRAVTCEWQFQGQCYDYTPAPVTKPVASNITA